MIESLERRGINLSLEQKLLLAETGTVEQVLSILTGSTVEVKVVKQTKLDEIIERKVVIFSPKGQPLVYAKSKVYCRFLPKEIVSKIMQKKLGIGTIIHNAGLETCRVIVRFGISRSKHPYRVYRIIHQGRAIFEIREEILI